MPTVTITAPPTTEPPRALADAITEMYRRLAEASAAGKTGSDDPPSTVVVNDAPHGLQDPVVRAAVEHLARLGRKANMSIELRGEPLAPSHHDFGGSALLRMAALGPNPNVYYRCLRPLWTYPVRSLCMHSTRVVHRDPEIRARGESDTAIFLGFHPDRAWAIVRFDDQDEPSTSTVLVSDLLVEVGPDDALPDQDLPE